MVDPGEVAEFTLNVANLDNALGANTKIKIEIIPTEGAVVPGIYDRSSRVEVSHGPSIELGRIRLAIARRSFNGYTYAL